VAIKQEIPMKQKKKIHRFNSRFPRHEIIQIFAFCVMATHSWTIINMFREVASWSLSLSLWDLVGTVSYTLIALLFETVVFFYGSCGGWISPAKKMD